MDLYHCQIVEGDLATKHARSTCRPGVGHMQIAGVPERHEPDIGEVNYPYLFDADRRARLRRLDRLRVPPARRGTSEGLGWLRRERAR